MLQSATDLLRAAGEESSAGACDQKFSALTAGPPQQYVDVPQPSDNIHAGHGLRTNHLREELARAARRRQSFRAH